MPYDYGPATWNWKMATVRNWGEDPAGTWTLKVKDKRTTNTHATSVVNQWSVYVYGHAPPSPFPPSPPPSPPPQAPFGCGSAAVLSVTCCTVIESCQVTPLGSCTSMTSTLTLNAAGTYYQANGWAVYKDASSNSWKYEQCSSALTATITAAVACPTELPHSGWSFSGSWASSLRCV